MAERYDDRDPAPMPPPTDWNDLDTLDKVFTVALMTLILGLPVLYIAVAIWAVPTH